MPHVEERDFNFRIEARCIFPDDYEGESDGYAWVPEFHALAAEMLRNLVAAVRARPSWKVHPANRGRSTDDEVTLVVERTIGELE